MDDATRQRVESILAAGDAPDAAAVWEELQPFDVAELLGDLDAEAQARVLRRMPSAFAARVLEHLDPEEQYHHLLRVDEERSRAILAEMPPDSVVDLLGALYPREQKEVLRRLRPEELEAVRRLMTYPESSAGGRMTTEYFAVRRQWTAEQVLAWFREVGREVEIAHYVYVVDRRGKLVGVTSMRDILLADPSARVEDIMRTELIAVPADADQEEAARLLGQYDFGAMPVVDGQGRLVGVISVDDILDVAEEEATEDIQRIAAMDPLRTSYRRATVWTLYQRRVVWLAALVLVSLVSSGVIAAFETTLQSAIALAFFIPLLIGSGGNTGSQSAMLLIRALATRDVEMGEWARALGKEIVVGVLLGTTLGLIAALLGVFRGGAVVGVIVGLSMVAIILSANLIGMALPFVLSRLRLDPAVASSPLITTIMDAMGLLIYFSIATWALTTL